MRNTNLAEVEQGKSAVVLGVTVPGPHGVRLAGMGLLPGQRVSVLRNGRRRALLVDCGRTVIALSRPLAEAISVEDVA